MMNKKAQLKENQPDSTRASSWRVLGGTLGGTPATASAIRLLEGSLTFI